MLSIVDSKLNWCKYVSAKATKLLNLIVTVSNCPPYACSVWHPHTTKSINALESVQHRIACWASNSRWNPAGANHLMITTIYTVITT